MFGIFGHGNVHGLGQAVDEYGTELTFFQGHNEQSMVHAAVGYAKATRRRATLACTSSIGPGATNMVTGAAEATISRLPVLLFPGDTYATRYQGPVLQQLERPLADARRIGEAAELLRSAQRPLLISGGGARYSEAEAEVAAFAERLQIPVAETCAGKGTVADEAWYLLGGLGLEGNPATNEIA